jgi:DNA-binding HxlR family transcriptional regulator
MSSVPGKRSYADRCGVARALDVVGERWTLLVVRELLLGSKRFADLRAGLPGLSADVLTQRLRDLEAGDLVRRRTLEPPTSARVYELTERGRDLESVVLALGRFGSGLPFREDAETFGPDAFMLALKTWFSPEAARGAEGAYAVRVAGQTFRAEIGDGRFDVRRAPAEDDARATITGEPGVLAAAIWHGGPLDDVAIEGDRRAAKRFLRAFPMPA